MKKMSLEEYRLYVMRKDKEMRPHLYLHKPIEEYVKNLYAFRHAFIVAELEDWRKYSVYDIWQIFEPYKIPEKEMEKLARYIMRLVEGIDEEEWQAQWNKPVKAVKVSDTFSPKLRWLVMERDGHKCVKCGRSAADGVKLHVDHVYPKSRGGMATLDNGQTLCDECNIGKGARVPVAHPT